MALDNENPVIHETKSTQADPNSALAKLYSSDLWKCKGLSARRGWSWDNEEIDRTEKDLSGQQDSHSISLHDNSDSDLIEADEIFGMFVL